MTGTTTLGLINIAVVTVIVLAAWIALVFHADAPPAWRRHEPSGHDMAGQAARMTARRQEENVHGTSRETEESTAARPDAGAPIERAAGDAPVRGEGRVTPDGSIGRCSFRYRATGSPSAATRRRPGVAAA